MKLENGIFLDKLKNKNSKYIDLIENSLLKKNIKLPDWILEMDGMSGKKYRYFINNLIESLSEDARYLEVGCWKGSTSCSAIYNNKVKAYCIDNWSEFGGPKNIFCDNIQKCSDNCDDIEIVFEENDFKKVNYTQIEKYNVYLFDGPHEEQDQYDGLVHAYSALDNEFIFICDDWNWEKVRTGTMRAIEKTNLEVIFSIEIRTTIDNSYPLEGNTKENSDWHNGYYISVLKKSEIN
jgi:hypothetical protein